MLVLRRARYINSLLHFLMVRKIVNKKLLQSMSSPDFALAESISTSNVSYFLIIYIIILIYCCFGLAVVCDEYFVPALQKLSETYNLPPDIAGSTLMALGASVPELFASLIGVFVTKDDIGTGSIIGSSCFNLIAVPAACAFVASASFDKKLIINPMPVIRNSAFYGITILVLLLIIKDNRVDIPEALILLLFFVMYLALMIFSAQTMKKNLANGSLQDSCVTDNSYSSADSAIVESEKSNPIIRGAKDKHNKFGLVVNHHNLSNNYRLYQDLDRFHSEGKGLNYQQSNPLLIHHGSHFSCLSANDNKSILDIPFTDTEDADTFYKRKFKSASETTPLVRAFYHTQRIDNNDSPGYNYRPRHESRIELGDNEVDLYRSCSTSDLDCSSLGLALKNSTCLARSRAAGLSEIDGGARGHMNFANTVESTKAPKDREGHWVQSKWILVPMLPLTLSLKLLTPCKFKNTLWTIWTFLISITLIGALTYVAVWTVHMCSQTLGLPETVAGMTILSWGTGIPELIASIVLIKKTAQADMAVCNTIGSNVIDISFCLSVPW